MNTVLEEGVELAANVNDALKGNKHNCDVAICVPATHLVPVNGVIDHETLGTPVQKTVPNTKPEHIPEK